MGKYQLLRDRLAAELPDIQLMQARAGHRRRTGAGPHARLHPGHQRRQRRSADPARDRLSLEPGHGRARAALGRRHHRGLPRGASRDGVAANIAGGTHHAYARPGRRLLRLQRCGRRRPPDAGRTRRGSGAAAAGRGRSTSTCTRATARRRIFRDDPTRLHAVAARRRRTSRSARKPATSTSTCPTAAGDDEYLQALEQRAGRTGAALRSRAW